MNRHALIVYDTPNLGDDIQSLAALQYLPRVDYPVLRDHLGEFAAPGPADVRIILNGWFMGRRSWPPAPALDPLFVSFHISPHRYANYGHTAGTDFMLDDAALAYYRAHGPIGCRDTATFELLQSLGVPSYFSGCLTLTLRPPPNLGERREILIVEPHLDIADLISRVPAHLANRVAQVGHVPPAGLMGQARLAAARQLLDRYARAHLVITSRLHCALPCLAFGTPVLFVPPKWDPTRLEGIWPLLRLLRVADGRAAQTIAWDRPEPNFGAHEPFARQLAATCRRFAGTGGLVAQAQDELTIRIGQLVIGAKSGVQSAEAAGVRRLRRVRRAAGDAAYALGHRYPGLKRRPRWLRAIQTRWSDIERFPEGWNRRVEQMAELVPDGASVVDLGCGTMSLRQIKPGIGYLGVDYRFRGPGCIVADLNAGEFPEVRADVAFVSGLLEYLARPQSLIAWIAGHCQRAVISYCPTELQPDLVSRRRYAWRNDLSRGELIGMFERAGLALVSQAPGPVPNELFVFARPRPPRDPALLIRDVRDAGLTYLDAAALADLDRYVTALEARGTSGLVVEAGCALGGSAIVMAGAKAPARPMRVFDVFGMIPPPGPADGDDVHRRYEVIASGKSQGINGAGYYGYEQNLLDRVRGAFEERGLPLAANHVSLVRGLFEETMHLDSPVALAHLDCDWYESVMTCLRRIVPHVVRGGIIVIDDYDTWSGCRRAVDEFFAGKEAEFRFERGARLAVIRVSAASAG